MLRGRDRGVPGLRRSYPGAVLLVDTYDTVGGQRAIQVARELATNGHRLCGIRLDSGDLEALSRKARRLLDRAGFADATIFASGGIDEYAIDHLLSAGAAIDGFGVGTKMAVAADAPYLDMAYKLVAFDGEPRLKLSEGKALLPGAKQVWRTFQLRIRAAREEQQAAAVDKGAAPWAHTRSVDRMPGGGIGVSPEERGFAGYRPSRAARRSSGPSSDDALTERRRGRHAERPAVVRNP